jgi:hypothetical protein
MLVLFEPPQGDVVSYVGPDFHFLTQHKVCRTPKMGQCSSFMKKLVGGQGGSTTEQGHSLPWKGGKKTRAAETGAAMGSPATEIQGIMGGQSARFPRLPGGLDGLVTLVGGLEAFKAGNAKIQPPDPRNTDVRGVVQSCLSRCTHAWMC